MTAPDILICTRFGIGVTDEGWLRHRIQLIRGITAPSLLSQTDRGFHWTIFTDPDLPEWLQAELEDMIAPFGGRAVLRQHGALTRAGILTAIAELGLARDGFMLTARLDDDDALHRTNVERVREEASRWLHSHAPDYAGAVFTYPLGYEWIMYDMIDINKRLKGVDITRRGGVRPYRLPFLGTSIFALSPVSEGVTTHSVQHPEGVLLHEAAPFEMIQVEADEPMWLYCRHKQTDSSTQKAGGPVVDVSLDDLAAAFGIDPVRVAAYIESADSHGYITRKKTVSARTKARIALDRAEQALAKAGPGSPDRKQLESEIAACRKALVELSQGLVGQAPSPTKRVEGEA